LKSYALRFARAWGTDEHKGKNERERLDVKFESMLELMPL